MQHPALVAEKETLQWEVRDGGGDVVGYLQELVGVRLHQLGVHLAVLQGGGVETL